ncbi:MAG: hypothetical protein R6X33_10905 [Candidatus Brocadiia bacterium]
MGKVNGKSDGDPELTPRLLRAYLAYHAVGPGEVAEKRGVSRQSVSAALNADVTGRPVSQDLLREIHQAANSIIAERREEEE